MQPTSLRSEGERARCKQSFWLAKVLGKRRSAADADALVGKSGDITPISAWSDLHSWHLQGEENDSARAMRDET